MSFEQSPEFQRPAVDGPDAVVDFLETDVFAGTGDRYVDPAPIPADAAIGADIPDLKAVRILQGRQFRWHGAWRGFIEGSRRLHIERFVRPLMVELLTEAIEALLLRAAVGRWRPVVSALRVRCMRS